MEVVRLHGMVKNTAALGPGIRAAIWFQGCERNCLGCMSPDSRPLDGGREVAIDSIICSLLSIDNIDGVTISGGEPFLQIDALYALIKGIREETELSIIVYTGFTIEELKRLNNRKIDRMINEMIDVLIDGEYIQELNDDKALRGSSNQVVHFLSGIYNEENTNYCSSKRDVEIVLSNKTMSLIGIPDKETLEAWEQTKNEINNKSN